MLNLERNVTFLLVADVVVDGGVCTTGCLLLVVVVVVRVHSTVSVRPPVMMIGVYFSAVQCRRLVTKKVLNINNNNQRG